MIAFCYTAFIRPKLEKVKKNDGTPLLDAGTLGLIDYACKRGVESAEQLCNAGKITKDERNAEALGFAFDVMKKAGIVPQEYLEKHM